MTPFFQRITSRKFILALVAAGAAFIKGFYPDFPDEALYAIVGSLMGYVVVEGGIDAISAIAKWWSIRNQPGGEKIDTPTS